MAVLTRGDRELEWGCFYQLHFPAPDGTYFVDAELNAGWVVQDVSDVERLAYCEVVGSVRERIAVCDKDSTHDAVKWSTDFERRKMQQNRMTIRRRSDDIRSRPMASRHGSMTIR